MKKIKTIVRTVLNLFTERHAAILWRASVLMKRAMDEAEEKFGKDGHRYFVIWDCSQRRLIPITYDHYKGRGDSYQYLSRRGRFVARLTRSMLKELCFYYTASKNGGKPCSGLEMEHKTQEFQSYYIKLAKSDRIGGTRKLWNWRSFWKRITSFPV